MDRAELRVRLLQTWMEAPLNRHFPAGLALSREEREVAVEQRSALACFGLRQDSLDVRFDDLKGDLQGLSRHDPRKSTAATDAVREPEPEYPPLIDASRAELTKHRRPPTVRGRSRTPSSTWSAGWGSRPGRSPSGHGGKLPAQAATPPPPIRSCTASVASSSPPVRLATVQEIGAGGDPIQREQRLRRTDRNRLPLCLAGDRSPLDASRTIRCRAAPWQGALAGELRRFWKQMAQRTHPAVEHEPEPELDGRRRRRY